MRLSKEIREKIKKVTEEILWEEKKKRELLNRNMDYDFLQTLINKCDDNPDLAITVYLKDGSKVVIQTKKNNRSYIPDYDGEPSVNEMEIR